MNHTTSTAASAMNLCARSTAVLASRSKVMAFTLRINSYTQSVDKVRARLTSRLRHAHVIHMLDLACTLMARALSKGSDRAHKGVARWVAGVLVGVLCLSGTYTSEAQLVANKELKILAAKQLTDKQYKCHNEIVYRESRFDINAVNGSHHGYYQMRSKSMQGKPYDYQFYIYWYYVSKRYGLDYEIPDYCKALHHLKTKGWQ